MKRKAVNNIGKKTTRSFIFYLVCRFRQYVDLIGDRKDLNQSPNTKCVWRKGS